jgi:hypothetical protein
MPNHMTFLFFSELRTIIRRTTIVAFLRLRVDITHSLFATESKPILLACRGRFFDRSACSSACPARSAPPSKTCRRKSSAHSRGLHRCMQCNIAGVSVPHKGRRRHSGVRFPSCIDRFFPLYCFLVFLFVYCLIVQI